MKIKFIIFVFCSSLGMIAFGQGYTTLGVGTSTPVGTLHVHSSEGIMPPVTKVTLTGWPDYVFDKSYNLMPLSETEQYIQANGHLPNVPSAAEVEADGMSVGEMNKVLLQKVEELTLYVIELQKQIDELKKERE